MQYLIDNILAELRKTVHFRCKEKPGGGYRKIEFTHQFGAPLGKRQFRKWMPPSLKLMYAQFNGATLFRPTPMASAGFVFYSITEIAQETANLQEIFDEQREAYHEDSGYDQLDDWLAGLIPVAAPICSGDRYVLDTLNRREDGECPILLLDHEYYYGGACSPYSTDEIAATCVDLLGLVLQDPLKYCNLVWFDEQTGNQWRADSAIVAGQMQVTKKRKIPLAKKIITPSDFTNLEYKKVSLADLALPVHKFALPDRVICLSAPLLDGRLCVVRVISPTGTVFCDVDIYWPWVASVYRWAKTFSAADKLAIRKEQKAARWKSDRIYHDGPSTSRDRNYLEFCVLADDKDNAIDYVKSQIDGFELPLIRDDAWNFDIENIQGEEGNLANLVMDFDDDQDMSRLAALIAVCRDLEAGIQHPIQTTVRAKRRLLSIFSIGPNYKTGLLEHQHVWRAHLLRLLGWPGGILSARMCLALPLDAQVCGNDGNPIDWRSELRAYEQEIMQKYPMVDFKYTP